MPAREESPQRRGKIVKNLYKRKSKCKKKKKFRWKYIEQDEEKNPSLIF